LNILNKSVKLSIEKSKIQVIYYFNRVSGKLLINEGKLLKQNDRSLSRAINYYFHNRKELERLYE